MTIETPIVVEEPIEEVKPPTVEEQLAAAQARCEELYAATQSQANTIGEMQAQKAADDATIAALRLKAESELPQIINAIQAELDGFAVSVKALMGVVVSNPTIFKLFKLEAFKAVVADSEAAALVKALSSQV